MIEKQIIYSNAKIHYKTYGKGTPVLLIHGFAEDSRVWDRQVEYLQKDHWLIIPDLPGSGQSELIKDPKTGIEEYAECIYQIIQAEKIDRCIMIGHSMGGYITLAFAEKYPGLLIAFGLFHSSAYADDAAKIEIRKKAIGFIETNGPWAFLKTSIPGLFYERGNYGAGDALLASYSSGHSKWPDEYDALTGHSTTDSSGHLEWPDESVVSDGSHWSGHTEHPSGHSKWPDGCSDLITKGKAFTSEALIQYYRAMIARPDRTGILKRTRVPVLMILGEHDKAVPIKQGLEQSHLPQQTYVYILRNSAHMGMLEETDRANEILAYFLLNQ